MKELLQEISNLKSSNRSPAIELWMKTLASHARENELNSSDVDELVKFGESRSSAVQFFQNLASLGAGRFVSGRKGKKSRIEWGACGATEVAEAFLNQGPHQSLAKVEYTQERTSEPKPSNDEVMLLEHRYQLRPNLVVPICLPSDFSSHEAQRLSDYIRTLPFST